MAAWTTRDRAEVIEARVIELETEVKRLKQELAAYGLPSSPRRARDVPPPVLATGALGSIAAVQGVGRNQVKTPVFRPVPKPTGKKR